MTAFLLDEALGQVLVTSDLATMDRAQRGAHLPRGVTLAPEDVYGPDPVRQPDA